MSDVEQDVLAVLDRGSTRERIRQRSGVKGSTLDAALRALVRADLAEKRVDMHCTVWARTSRAG